MVLVITTTLSQLQLIWKASSCSARRPSLTIYLIRQACGRVQTQSGLRTALRHRLCKPTLTLGTYCLPFSSKFGLVPTMHILQSTATLSLSLGRKHLHSMLFLKERIKILVRTGSTSTQVPISRKASSDKFLKASVTTYSDEVFNTYLKSLFLMYNKYQRDL